jgi:hypothetical protein
LKEVVTPSNARLVVLMDENVVAGPSEYPRKTITNGLDALTRLAAYLYSIIQKILQLEFHPQCKAIPSSCQGEKTVSYEC